MSASLVGSEMCIRDSLPSLAMTCLSCLALPRPALRGAAAARGRGRPPTACLLYTSDAADDM
eukprot:12308888-Alexandrium_andersonii.AAC.1